MKKCITWIFVMIALFFLTKIPYAFDFQCVWHFICDTVLVYIWTEKITNWIFRKEEE